MKKQIYLATHPETCKESLQKSKDINVELSALSHTEQLVNKWKCEIYVCARILCVLDNKLLSKTT